MTLTLVRRRFAASPLQLVSRPGVGTAAVPLSLEAAYREHAGYLASLALRVLGRDDEVDDVVHEVFLGATRGLASIRDPLAVRAWLGTFTLRVARKRLRRRRLWSFLGLDVAPDYEDALVAPGADPETRAILGRVYGVLDGLPASQRIAWALRYIEGEPLAEVARLCECSLATAKRWIAAAQATIEEAFSDE